jgi:hypothetical protein
VQGLLALDVVVADVCEAGETNSNVDDLENVQQSSSEQLFHSLHTWLVEQYIVQQEVALLKTSFRNVFERVKSVFSVFFSRLIRCDLFCLLSH